VLPLWVEQILAGHELTITQGDMTRFLMSLDDSVDLVLHAFRYAEQGDLFVKKSPATTMHTLALALMDVLGKSVPIKILGARHGEKKFESLLSAEDMARAIDEQHYYRVPKDKRTLAYEIEPGGVELNASAYTSDNTQQLDREGAAGLLRTIPELKRLIAVD
jgi:UDP-glucose 4-epimerase